MLDAETEQYYNTYFDLFMLDGWNQFLADVQAAADTINLLALTDAKELHIAQGQMQVFQKLLNWQDSITNTYDAVKRDDEEGLSPFGGDDEEDRMGNF